MIQSSCKIHIQSIIQFEVHELTYWSIVSVPPSYLLACCITSVESRIPSGNHGYCSLNSEVCNCTTQCIIDISVLECWLLWLEICRYAGIPARREVYNHFSLGIQLCLTWSFLLDSTYPVKDLDESDTDSSGIVYHGTNVKIESKV